MQRPAPDSDKGSVLVIEGDEWVASLLTKYLAERGYTVESCNGARQGFMKACQMMPDCIICNVDLPDIDGFWVARRIRTEQSSVATTPFLFLTGSEDTTSRLQGLHVGADVYLTKPFTHEEVVAQVEALIDMARRLRERRDSFLSAPPQSREGAAFEGDLAQMSLATVLTMLEMERRAGELTVVSADKQRKAHLLIENNGGIGPSKLNGTSKPPLEILRKVLKWKKGKFYFRSLEPEGAPLSVRGSIGAFLLEAMRLEDESDAEQAEAQAIDVDWDS